MGITSVPVSDLIAGHVLFSFTTLAASVGAGVPSASLVTILMVLEATGLPTSDVGLLYSIDWFL